MKDTSHLSCVFFYWIILKIFADYINFGNFTLCFHYVRDFRADNSILKSIVDTDMSDIARHIYVKFRQNSSFPEGSLIFTYVLDACLNDRFLVGDTSQFHYFSHYKPLTLKNMVSGKIHFFSCLQYFLN